MTLSELKEDFYKRYLPSSNYLHYTANGMLCPLLGYPETEDAPSVSCALSMGVRMFARALGGEVIKVQNNASDKYLIYNFSDNIAPRRGIDAETIRLIRALGAENLTGAEILYECTIPEFLPRREVFSLTLVQSLMKVSDIEADIAKTAATASLGNNTGAYLALAASRGGYCTFVSSGVPKNYPLPLTGYKIVSAHCIEKDIDRSTRIKYAFGVIRRMYPHITSIAEVTEDMLISAKDMIKDKTAARYMYHLVKENSRIEKALAALKKCNVKTLFEEINKSQRSMEKYWNVGKEHAFLARCARGIQGVAAVRCWENGIIAITAEDKIDYAIGMICDGFEENIGYQPTFCISQTM